MLYIDKTDQPQLGVKAYRDLIAAVPDSGEAAEARYRLGIYHFRIKDYESAQQSFDAIVNKFPNLANLSHNAQLMLAKSYEEAGAYKKAIATYDNVVNRHPESDRAAQALTNKAKIQKDYLKDRTAAEQTYQSLIEQNITRSKGRKKQLTMLDGNFNQWARTSRSRRATRAQRTIAHRSGG